MNINILKGKVLTDVHVQNGEDIIIFTTNEGKKYKMFHYQGCCEDVHIESIEGDLLDLISNPITMAEEVIKEQDGKYDHETWTFYKLATVKGYVTIRWYGSSNGYYSESVDFEEVKDA